MGKMTVEQDYVARIQAWVQEESKKRARNAKEKGVNAFSRFTQVELAKYGFKGFPNSVIGRWYNGQVNAEVEAETLKQIGILKGFGRVGNTFDPDLAGRQAYLWLHGDDPNSALTTPPPVAHIPATDDAQAHPLVAQIKSQTLSPAVLRAIAMTAIDQLAITAASATNEEPEEEEDMKPTPLTYMLEGWMSTNETDEAELAKQLKMTTARVHQVLNGAVLTKAECEAVANLTNLEFSTLVAWGVCEITS